MINIPSSLLAITELRVLVYYLLVWNASILIVGISGGSGCATNVLTTWWRAMSHLVIRDGVYLVAVATQQSGHGTDVW